jgi:hypothetical protein
MSTQIGGTVQVVGQDVFATSTTQNHVLGDKAFSPDGRAFRYVKAGAVALIPGQVIQSPAVVTNHVGLTPTAVSAVGDTSVTVTLAAAAATANQYAGGYLCVAAGTTGFGQALLIASHPAAPSSGTLTLTLADPFRIATSGTIVMDLIANRHDGVVVTPGALTGTVVGVAISAIPAAGFGWLQTRGVAPILTTGTPAVGSNVAAIATSGQIGVDTAALTHFGSMARAGVATQYSPVQINFD